MRSKIPSVVVMCLCALSLATIGYGADDPASQLKQGEVLVNTKQYEQAEGIYLAIVQQGSEYAFAAQKGLALLYVATNDMAKADAAVAKLITAFAQQPTLPREICRVGDAYLKAGKYDKARQVYQYVLDKWTGTQNVLWAKAGLAKLDIAQGNDAAAEAKIAGFVSDFNDHPELCEAVFEVAEAYWDQAAIKRNANLIEEQHKYLRKTLGECDRIISDFPNTELRKADSYFMSGDCYRLMDERADAIARYEELVRRWPSYECAWGAQFLIGQGYEQLWLISGCADAAALAKAKAAYQKVVENYPNSRAAKVAAKWLKVNSK